MEKGVGKESQQMERKNVWEEGKNNKTIIKLCIQ